jgi:hypothetical protein
MTIAPTTGKMSEKEFRVETYWHEGQKWWHGDQVAMCLGYAKASVPAMLKYHVPALYQRPRALGLFGFGKNPPMDLNDAGVRHLISKRTGEAKADFEVWFEQRAAEDCQGPRKTPQQFSIRNETDLRYKVLDYVRKFYPQAITIAGLGELQDTEGRRIDAYRKGYTGGQPDLLIMNSNRVFKAFALEFKHPGGCGELRENQRAFLDRLQKEGCKTMVSCDYDEIITAIFAYFADK